MRTDAQTIEARKAADKAQYQQEWAATTPAEPSAQELVELCNIHGDKMWDEGWYTSARALYLAAEEIERLRVALAKATQPAASRCEATPNPTAKLGA